MANFVFSPSNINAHAMCPLKAYAMREKLITWKDSPQKDRGIQIHASLEKALQTGDTANMLSDPKVDARYVTDVLHHLLDIKNTHDCELYTEHEMALKKDLTTRAGWWDEDAFIRCKADICLVKPKEFIVLGDWKTGKIYAESERQMQTEALIAARYYNTPTVLWELLYVDLGKTKSGKCNFHKDFSDAIDSVHIMQQMHALFDSGGPWLAKKNPFCRWCDWYHSENCPDSQDW